MPNQELVDKIYKLRGAGQTDGQIKSDLLSAGFKKEEIEENFLLVGEHQKNYADILYKIPVPKPPLPVLASNKSFRKNIFLVFGFVAALAIGFWFTRTKTPELQCEYKEMAFYYSMDCPVSKRVLDEKSVEKLEYGGIKVAEYDIEKDQLPQEIYDRGSMSVPTFIINFEEYSGYYSFEGLKGLLGCN